jgi:glycosyltransferase involved in cell wall biosynthesis
MPINEQALVSAIITTKNESANIKNCIDSIKKQTYNNIELIVVDNFSTDDTAEISKKLGATVYSKGNERSAQRNYGVKVADGEYIIYLDADMILSPNIIQECVQKTKDNTSALYIPERIVGEGFWIRVRDFERSFYTATYIDAVRFVRRTLFLEVGGFDEELVGPEDWDFDRKIREIAETGTINAFIYHNEGSFDMVRYLNKKGYYSDGLQKYIEKWGANDSQVEKQVGIRYRLFDVFLEKGKWKQLIFHPVLALAMYFLRFQVAIKYLLSR